MPVCGLSLFTIVELQWPEHQHNHRSRRHETFARVLCGLLYFFFPASARSLSSQLSAPLLAERRPLDGRVNVPSMHINITSLYLLTPLLFLTSPPSQPDADCAVMLVLMALIWKRYTNAHSETNQWRLGLGLNQGN